MKPIIEFGNLLANLPLWLRVLLILVVLGLLVTSLAYVWGLRPQAIKKVVQADIPKSRDPRDWLVYFSRFGWKGKTVVTVLSFTLVVALSVPLMFSHFGVVAKVLGRNQARAVTSHLFVQHYENYTHLFLEEVSSRNYSQVEDSLQFQNISPSALTHFRILAFVFVDLANLADFYRFYSIDTGTQYIPLGTFDVGSLKSEETYTMRMEEIYGKLLERTNVSENELNDLLFPDVGEAIACDFKQVRQAPHQAFTKKPELHDKFFVQRAKFGDSDLDAICGFPVKLILNYRSGTSQVSNVLIGGTYYYGKLKDNKIIPHAVAVASFVKPRFSLIREKSGAEDEIVNMDVEISGRRFVRIPYRPNPNILAYYSVSEPEGDDQLDQQLSVTVDNGIEARLATRAQILLKAGEVEEAVQTLDRLLNLSPKNEQARMLRARISESTPVAQ